MTETFIPLMVVEYVAELFAAGVRGRGVKATATGSNCIWLFGEQNWISWW